jgi:two-component sensor histidine kinase
MSYVLATALKTNRPLVSQENQPRFSQPTDMLDGDDDAGNTGAGQEIDLRQLRHHTKNTLQRILSMIAAAPGLCDTPAGEKIARDLEYRICLSANISNALFGLTGAPGSMAERLRQLAGAVVDMMRDVDQVIRIGVSVRGSCPVELREAVVRSAHELIGNAIKHGMKGRSSGRITVRLVTDHRGTTLTILDNGWGFSGTPRPGEGLALARGFAVQHGGSLGLDGVDGTVATLELPH